MTNNYQMMQPIQSTVPVIQDSEILASSSRLAEVSYALAEHTAFKNNLNAALSKTVMDNTASLAATEAYYNQIAPGGADEYRFIIQAYARMSMELIWGGAR